MGNTEIDAQGHLQEAPQNQLTAPGALFELVREEVRGNPLQVFRYRHRSLAGLLEASDRFGGRTLVVDGDVRLDFSAHLEAARAVAVALQVDLGVRAGDRVGLYAANRWEWIVAFSAVVLAGGIPAAFNGWWTTEEVAHAVGVVEPVLVIGDAPRLARLHPMAGAPATIDLDQLVGIVEARRGQVPQPAPTDEDATALLLFTSGTTGRAKAVMVSHRSVVGFVHVQAYRDALTQTMRGVAAPRVGDELPPSSEVVLITAPLFHTSMLQGMVLAAIDRGNSVVLLPGRFDPERVLATIEKERVTMWSALGSAAPRVCASEVSGRYDTTSLRRLGVGGATVSPAVQQRLRETFPTARSALGMGYTSTEGGAVVASIGGPEYERHPEATGRVTVTTELEIRDERGGVLPDGVDGAVHVRSPYVMLGYWNDPEATAAVLGAGGWLAMGDVGRMEEGRLYINARARDLIIVSAENVSPTEVEYCLEAHPGVMEAAVFALDDPATGDAVCAVVSTAAGAAPAWNDLDVWCRERLAYFKVPTHAYVVEEPLPRTATGKLLKAELRARAQSGALGPDRAG